MTDDTKIDENRLTLELKHGEMRVSLPTDLAPSDIPRIRGWLEGLVAASEVQAECYVATKETTPSEARTP